MNRFRFLILLTALNLVLAIHSRAEEPEAPPANSRYKIGMTMDDARKLMSKPYRTSTSGIVYEDGDGPTHEEREKDDRYGIRVEDEGLYLYFNWNHRLIRIRDVTKKKQEPPPAPKMISGAGHEKAVRDAVLFFLENTPPKLLRPWILDSKDSLQKKEFVYDAEKRLYLCDAWEVNLTKRTATIKSETEMLDGVLAEVDGVLRITDTKIWKIIPRPASLK